MGGNMLELRGKYNKAKVFTDNVDSEAISQIIDLCNRDFAKGSKIRIMPDTHAGVGCTIGTTMTIKDKVVPNLVGVDIGCGMEVVKLGEKEIDFEALDNAIRTLIPSGGNIRITPHKFTSLLHIHKLHCLHQVDTNKAVLSIGTLGGGNHFIEIDKDEQGNLYLVVHSGSRHLGNEVAKLYQELGYKALVKSLDHRMEIINKLKREGRQQEIQAELEKCKPISVSKDFAYVQGKNLRNYLDDMNIVQEYADVNRAAIAITILDALGLTIADHFTTVHNYIDTDTMILRKGAVSAENGEPLIIPMNMRDGSLICIGKGNADWNFSAPHGAGRLMSRSKAKEMISLSEFEDSMKGIYTTSVGVGTIDESPMAYKPMDEIVANIQDTVTVMRTIKPIYNFKAGE
jgi:RNA-splicing ligase RtcB